MRETMGDFERALAEAIEADESGVEEGRDSGSSERAIIRMARQGITAFSKAEKALAKGDYKKANVHFVEAEWFASRCKKEFDQADLGSMK